MNYKSRVCGWIRGAVNEALDGAGSRAGPGSVVVQKVYSFPPPWPGICPRFSVKYDSLWHYVSRACLCACVTVWRSQTLLYSRTPHNPYPLRGRSVLWIMRGYGLSELWVRLYIGNDPSESAYTLQLTWTNLLSKITTTTSRNVNYQPSYLITFFFLRSISVRVGVQNPM